MTYVSFTIIVPGSVPNDVRCAILDTKITPNEGAQEPAQAIRQYAQPTFGSADWRRGSATDNWGLSLFISEGWHNAKQDIAQISKRFPDILITLAGSCHDYDTGWRMYFKGGKAHEACLQWSPFDETKLEDVI